MPKQQSWRAPETTSSRRRRLTTYAVIAAVVVIAILATWAVIARSVSREEPPDTSAIDTTLATLSESEYVEVIGPVEIGGQLGSPTLSGVLRADGTVAGSLGGDSGSEMSFVDTGDEVYVSAPSRVWTSLGVSDVGGSTDWVHTGRGLVLPDRIVFTPSEMVSALSESEIEDITSDGERVYANGMRARMDGPGAVMVTDPSDRQFRAAEADKDSSAYLERRLDESLEAEVELIQGPGGSYVTAPVAVDDHKQDEADNDRKSEDVGDADDEDAEHPQGGQAPTQTG